MQKIFSGDLINISQDLQCAAYSSEELVALAEDFAAEISSVM